MRQVNPRHDKVLNMTDDEYRRYLQELDERWVARREQLEVYRQRFREAMKRFDAARADLARLGY